ncbi:hypothetical protein QN372_00295 [Undibacterium sp. RTI2.1]|uniref:hypothetical protein n=1 Tax=unclassified Undibacterium TaxID=2630295 RepID=UPI002AB3B39A|nr:MULTISPECIES: hypothetical protein [unclassified Undibacterium]MDY7537578.1 hypothetical protein [Undibacterium sp. 5I1]MEB0029178.1 hypothetical protein [Undibacterium sp. RTI2.1]MEB0115486.1 hypothetical protein [Undibacterium sp. RTI2.2]MEB0231963.1 hypothetical protein [Undibacterium sp. 10I3]MEB0256314.1 hypothetical protein [Undibacterium sp. 5I1]
MANTVKAVSDADFLKEALKWYSAQFKAEKGDFNRMTGVCWAVYEAGKNLACRPNANYWALLKTEQRLSFWIGQLLGPSVYLQGWIGRAHPETDLLWNELSNEELNIKMAHTRIAWMKWMIQHCEELDGK